MADCLECIFCGAEVHGSLVLADKRGWDWWTGFLPKREACCPSCAKTKRTQLTLRKEYANSDAAREEWMKARSAARTAVA